MLRGSVELRHGSTTRAERMGLTPEMKTASPTRRSEPGVVETAMLVGSFRRRRNTTAASATRATTVSTATVTPMAISTAELPPATDPLLPSLGELAARGKPTVAIAETAPGGSPDALAAAERNATSSGAAPADALERPAISEDSCTESPGVPSAAAVHAPTTATSVTLVTEPTGTAAPSMRRSRAATSERAAALDDNNEHTPIAVFTASSKATTTATAPLATPVMATLATGIPR